MTCGKVAPAENVRTIAYLDYAANTPIFPEVISAMHVAMQDSGMRNAASSHPLGNRAQDAVERARTVIQHELIGRPDGRLIFTSGGTESNNMALRCFHMSTIYGFAEHASVINSVTRNFQTVKMRYSSMAELAKQLEPDEYGLASFARVNNELGFVTDMTKIADSIPTETIVHADYSQAPGKEDYPPIGREDAVTLSAHKFGGPVGIGALWLSPRALRAITPLMRGGHSEHGLRPGTLPYHQIIGMQVAAERIKKIDKAKILELSSELKSVIIRHGGIINQVGSLLHVPGIINATFPHMPKDLQVRLAKKGICASSGSACTKGGPSHILQALDIDPSRTIRFSIGWQTSKQDLELLRKALKAVA